MLSSKLVYDDNGILRRAVAADRTRENRRGDTFVVGYRLQYEIVGKTMQVPVEEPFEEDLDKIIEKADALTAAGISHDVTVVEGWYDKPVTFGPGRPAPRRVAEWRLEYVLHGGAFGSYVFDNEAEAQSIAAIMRVTCKSIDIIADSRVIDPLADAMTPSP